MLVFVLSIYLLRRASYSEKLVDEWSVGLHGADSDIPLDVPPVYDNPSHHGCQDQDSENF